MRLIDEIKLTNHIENQWHLYGYDYDALQILGDIEDFPIVDAVPVRHGHWILTGNGKLVCSECSCQSAMSRQFTGAQYKSKYCPNCGAKMEVSDEE